MNSFRFRYEYSNLETQSWNLNTKLFCFWIYIYIIIYDDFLVSISNFQRIHEKLGLHCMFLPLGDSDHFFPHSVGVFFLAHSFSLLVLVVRTRAIRIAHRYNIYIYFIHIYIYIRDVFHCHYWHIFALYIVCLQLFHYAI